MLRNAVLPVHFPENRVIRFNVSSVTIEGWVGGGGSNLHGKSALRNT